jgi:ParB family chromosome partitioning protein
MSKFDKLDRNKMKQRLDVLDKGTSDRFETIPVDAISPNPHQPRKSFDEVQLQELAHSIKKDGLLQPITVKKNPDSDGYTLVAGERRWRAVKLLGKSSVKAIILSSDSVDLKILALIENTQRANLSPIEEAVSMRELMNIKNISKKELAELVCKSYDHTVSLLSLTDLPEKVQRDLQDNSVRISIQTLQSLSRVEDSNNTTALYFEIKEKKLNKKESLSLISKFKKKKTVEPNISSQKEKSTFSDSSENSCFSTKTSLVDVTKCTINENELSIKLSLELPIARKTELERVLEFLSKELGVEPLLV